MPFVYSLLLATSLYPVWRAWQANRRTALEHAILWAVAAWAGWLGAFAVGGDGLVGRYLALSLTACALVAVLGARRPHVGPWNFVVLTLLAVLLLPVAQGWGKPLLSVPFLFFLSATVLVGWVNYLPTRLLPAALLFGGGAAVEIARLWGAETGDLLNFSGRCLLAVSPWVALICLSRQRAHVSKVDREWLTFRDRFGVVWGQPVRDQFNRAAANAGWPVALTWFGLEVEGDRQPPTDDAILAMLRAVMKRFGTKEESP